MHFDDEMGFQFLGPRSTVLSPSDPRPPTVPQGQGKKAAQVETPAARKNGAKKGTVKGREGESSRLPVNEPMTGTLEKRASRSAYRLVIKEETRDGMNRERSAKEKRVSP